MPHHLPTRWRGPLVRALSFALMLIAPNVQAQSWSLVWSDEFDIDSINAANWVFETGAGGWGNNEWEYYSNRPENAVTHNGNLLIIARKESYKGSDYTSARMKTQGLQNWTYGKVEARIKLQQSKGIWPAFWMLGENITQVGWPKCGEIDIMEHINTETKTYGTMHWDNNGHAQYGGNTTCTATDYHVYGIEWDNTAIRWFLDGTQYWEGNISNNINSTEEFHSPQFIILNMAVGGNWPGYPDGTTVFPDTMFVDYVRVYQVATTLPQKDQQAFTATLYPNPAGDHVNPTLHVQSAGDCIYRARMINSVGQVVHEQTLQVGSSGDLHTTLPTENLPAGLYNVMIEGMDGVKCVRWVKE
ncbi:MAG: family 16 glycosylhydrolase [Flavobacteriales bacterium]|nr:family 16 glycosylhydrolase [Flavobacteriales bacterium]